MDSGQTTTRKGFFKAAGVALAGVFVLGGSKRIGAKAGPATLRAASVDLPPVMNRIRTAKGAVERKTLI